MQGASATALFRPSASSRTEQALAMVLVITGDDRYAPLVSRLERDGPRADLAKAKREALSFVDAEEAWDAPVVRNDFIGRLSQIGMLVLK